MRLLFGMFIRAYQVMFSPFFGPCCRFHPSCSEYAHKAIMKHGVMRGAWLAGQRLTRCHPWHPGGIDEVP